MQSPSAISAATPVFACYSSGLLPSHLLITNLFTSTLISFRFQSFQLLSAPSPLVVHLQQLLALFPNPLPPLPPFLREPSSYPWRDAYSIKTSTPPTSEEITLTSSPTSPTSASRRALPPIPNKPSRFRSPPTSPQSSIDVQSKPLPIRYLSDEVAISKMGMSAFPSPDTKDLTQEESMKSKVVGNASRVNKNDDIKEHTDQVNSQVGTTPILDLANSESQSEPLAGEVVERGFNVQEDLRTESPLTRMANIKKSDEEEKEVQGDQEVKDIPVPAIQEEKEAQDDLQPLDPTATIRSFSRGTLSRRNRPPSDYRHSLVAVDNETGEIVSILAENVQLQGQDSPAEEEEEDEVESSSSEDSEERTNEPLTPADESSNSLANLNKESEEEEDVTIVKPDSVIRSATTYRDLDADRPPSRAASILGEDTFAPPPIPVKNNRESIRSSVASAQFFSAAEDEEDLEDDEEDEDAKATREMLAGFTSLDNGHHESHRPDLLRDLKRHDDDDDDDARSDVSGSTVGGPAVQLWRKVKGQKKNKKKGGEEDELVTYGNVAPTKRENRSEPSSESVRTSRAETAMEGDDEDEEEEIQEATLSQSKINKRESVHSLSADPLQGNPTSEEEAEAEEEQDQEIQHDRIPTSATVKAVRLHGHRTRALLRTEEIRSVEDSVWRDAFEAESLPADAPYTHLAARGLSQYGTVLPSSSNLPLPGKEREQMELSNEDEGFDEGEMELLAPDEARRAKKLGIKPKTKAVKKRKNGGGGAYDYMQGGTVLVEFLAGSRLGASIIKAGDSALRMAVEPPTSENGNESSSSTQKTSELRKGAMSYIPVLPAHLLWWLGISDETSTNESSSNKVPASTPSAITSGENVTSSSLTSGLPLAQISSASTAFLEDFGKQMWGGVSDLSEGLSSWFGFSKSSSSDEEPSAQAVVDRMLAGDEDAQDWEYVVPDFDPNSLASSE